MLNKLESFLKQYKMVTPGDSVICAVSGGADSVAMLLAFHLLAEKLQISLSAVHFNHHLRGEESDRDEAFVKSLCKQYSIPLHIGHGEVVSGKKGLEAAARDARYDYFRTLPGKIATAHTADDNAETMLMHLIRGTGLKGLGGIAPVNGVFIRPMLCITRQEVISFLDDYHTDYITDSSNETDAFLRNRIRRHVMPLLKQENPRLALNMSNAALRLREDEKLLSTLSDRQDLSDVLALKEQPAAIRRRMLAAFLEECGVKEPEAEHIALAESLVFSDKPSARANFPGNIVLVRNYNRLEKCDDMKTLEPVVLPCPGAVELPHVNLRIICSDARTLFYSDKVFTVVPKGKIIVRGRMSGDKMRTPGGTKSLKKLFIDNKIPALLRQCVPVISDDDGVLGVYGFGINLDRQAGQLPAVRISFEDIK